jgi:uncharacterized protein
MKEIEAICDTDSDEANKLRALIDKIDGDNKEFHLHVNPTLNCNFKCWYCYEEHSANSKMAPETVNAILGFVEKQISANDSLNNFILSFFGGEPLMYFNQPAGPLMHKIQAICNSYNVKFNAHFTTNGYLLNNNLIRSIKTTNVAFQITLDGDECSHNNVRFTSTGGGSYKKILHNIELLAKDCHEVLIRINYTCSNIDSISHVINDLKLMDMSIRQFIVVDFQRVWQDRPIVVEDEILTTISSYVTLLNKEGFRCVYNSNIGPDHVRNSCYGDKKNHVLINYDGNVFFCTARDFRPEQRAGYLTQNGDIVWNQEIYEIYYSKKFSNRACFTCRIAPLCGGGCRQRALESLSSEECIYTHS